MLKRSWIVGALAMVLSCSMTAHGAMSVGTARRPEPKVVVIAEDLHISGDYYSDPINAAGYDAISISADWAADTYDRLLWIRVLARNAVTEEFRPIRKGVPDLRIELGGSLEPRNGYFLEDLKGLRCPQIQIHLDPAESGTANVSIYME